jgi:hypothetical protein
VSGQERRICMQGPAALQQPTASLAKFLARGLEAPAVMGVTEMWRSLHGHLPIPLPLLEPAVLQDDSSTPP